MRHGPPPKVGPDAPSPASRRGSGAFLRREPGFQRALRRPDGFGQPFRARTTCTSPRNLPVIGPKAPDGPEGAAYPHIPTGGRGGPDAAEATGGRATQGRRPQPQADAPAGSRIGDTDPFRRRDYIRSIIALPKPEQETCVAPCIRRAKS